MAKIEAVVFDIGNVLVEWQPERFYDGVVGAARRQALFETVDLHAMNDRIDSGEDFAAVVAQTANTFPDFASEIMLWHDRWSEIAAPAIAGTATLLQRLKRRGIPVMALSNIGEQTFAMAAQTYPVLGEFDRVFLSGALGMIKPDPAIYAAVEEATGHAPGSLLFIDDKVENIEAAQHRGWQVHHFTGAAALARRLTEASLIEESAA